MVASLSYVKAFEQNCPGVRLRPDERAELGRLIFTAQEDARKTAPTPSAVLLTDKEVERILSALRECTQDEFRLELRKKLVGELEYRSQHRATR